VSFLLKQESRLLCACYGVPAGQAGTLEYFQDCRFRGNENRRDIHPASPHRPLDGRGRGELLHSAKMVRFFQEKYPP